MKQGILSLLTKARKMLSILFSQTPDFRFSQTTHWDKDYIKFTEKENLSTKFSLQLSSNK